MWCTMTLFLCMWRVGNSSREHKLALYSELSGYHSLCLLLLSLLFALSYMYFFIILTAMVQQPQQATSFTTARDKLIPNIISCFTHTYIDIKIYPTHIYICVCFLCTFRTLNSFWNWTFERGNTNLWSIIFNYLIKISVFYYNENYKH